MARFSKKFGNFVGLLHPDGGSDRFEKNHVSRELLGLYAGRAPMPPLDGFRVGAFAKTRNSLRVGVKLGRPLFPVGGSEKS